MGCGVLLAFGFAVPPAAGQWLMPVAEPEEPFTELSRTLLGEPPGGWIELTPLASERPAMVLWPAPRVLDGGELLLEPQLPEGPIDDGEQLRRLPARVVLQAHSTAARRWCQCPGRAAARSLVVGDVHLPKVQRGNRVH